MAVGSRGGVPREKESERKSTRACAQDLRGCPHLGDGRSPALPQCPTSSPFPALAWRAGRRGGGGGGGPGGFPMCGSGRKPPGEASRNCHTMPLYQEFPGPGWGAGAGAEGPGGRLSMWGPFPASPPGKVCPPELRCSRLGREEPSNPSAQLAGGRGSPGQNPSPAGSDTRLVSQLLHFLPLKEG